MHNNLSIQREWASHMTTSNVGFSPFNQIANTSNRVVVSIQETISSIKTVTRPYFTNDCKMPCGIGGGFAYLGYLIGLRFGSIGTLGGLAIGFIVGVILCLVIRKCVENEVESDEKIPLNKNSAQQVKKDNREDSSCRNSDNPRNDDISDRV